MILRYAKELVVLLTFGLVLPLAAVEGDRARYIGGSITLAENQEGVLDSSGASALVFRGDRGKWETSYKSIVGFEYGNKSSRRVAEAIIVSPVFVAAKSKKHFLTLQVKDEAGKVQAAVFELSKGRYASIIADLEEKTGLKLQYETAPAKKGK